MRSLIAPSMASPFHQPAVKLGTIVSWRARGEVLGLTFHGLRHTCATLVLLSDVPVKVVSERLGHADVALTLRIYSHVLPGMQKNAADGLDEMLF
jgi:integrase